MKPTMPPPGPMRLIFGLIDGGTVFAIVWAVGPRRGTLVYRRLEEPTTNWRPR